MSDRWRRGQSIFFSSFAYIITVILFQHEPSFISETEPTVLVCWLPLVVHLI